MKKKKNKAETILLDVPWDSQFTRQIILGSYRHSPSRCPWALIGMSPYKDKSLRYAGAVGVISMRRPRDYRAAARRYGLAAVGVGVWSPGKEFSGLPYVDVDPRAIGKMAAEHLVNHGFRNFGLVSSDDTFHCPYRGEAFVAALKRRKLSCDVFDEKKKYPRRGEPIPTATRLFKQVRRWLVGLPKPLAVFVIDDSVAAWVCEVCRRSEIHVPEEVAILGVNDDNLFCDMSHPHLSSIRVPAEQVGYEAAKLLDAVLCRRKVPKRPILLPPMGVITRQSTDVLAIEDPYVTRAVRYIRQHACEGIFAKDVIAEVRLSRRPLERRFRKTIGRSPFAEIRRVQIEKIKMILAQTDDTLEAMAPECGFKTVTRMSMAFKKATGMPPGAWRKQFRIRRENRK